MDRGPFNPDRRAKAKNDFIFFCKTYGAEAFTLPWADFHYRAAETIQNAVWHGGLFVFAMPRGSGKSTICHYAVLWAMLNGWSPYTVFIGATADAAKRRLENLKASLRFNELLFEDYPDAICPIRHLSGEARKASGQKFKGKSTGIQWTQNQIVLAAVDLDYSESSESVVDVTGIEGSLRGRNYQKQSGEIVRVTLVLPDDPQTRESAKSVNQSQNREAILSGDAKYMAGPDRPLGLVMPATVVYSGDMVDNLLDRKLHPEWQGERVPFVESFPTNEKLWEQYAEIRSDSFRLYGNGEAANEFYRENREALEAGAKVTWEHRKFPDEVSAIQHAMNQKIRDEAAFMAEYQNNPLVSAENEITLPKPEVIAAHVSGVERGRVPNECELLTAFIDVSEKCLWWSVCAFGRDFTGTVIDYGVFPGQGLNYVTLRTLKKSLAQLKPGAGLEGSIQNGLDLLTKNILGEKQGEGDGQLWVPKAYRTETGQPRYVSRCLIDSGWGSSTNVVYRFCRRSQFSNVLLPSKGVGITAARKPLIDPTTKRKPGESTSGQWRVAPTRNGVPLAMYDTNHWKSFIANRWHVAQGDPGSLTLFEAKPYLHRMISEQVVAERCVRTTGHGRTVDQWDEIPGRDNHFLDCLVGCAVGASIQGAALPESNVGFAPRKIEKKKPRKARPVKV